MQTKLKLVDHSTTKLACINWHYSKSVPVPPTISYGVTEGEKFIGVIIFSRGASSNLLKPYGLKQTEGCELTRVALKNHKQKTSKFLAIAIKLLKKKEPQLKIIVSFADPNEGHHGGIYQATNWVYTGKTNKTKKYVDKSGRVWHSRQVSEKGFKVQQGNIRKTIKPSQCTIIEQEGKHRYLMPLDDDTRKKILHLSKPYPKRASSKGNVASGFQPEEGGAIPTDALQEKTKNG